MFKEKRFVNLINKRDALFAEHLNGKAWAELCNYPEERVWYCKTLMPLDKEIVFIANELIKKYKFDCPEIKYIHTVYSNTYLDKIYNKYNKQSSTNLEK